MELLILFCKFQLLKFTYSNKQSFKEEHCINLFLKRVILCSV